MRARIDSGALDLVFATRATPLPPGAVSETIATTGSRWSCAAAIRAGPALDGRGLSAAAHVTIAIRGDEDSENDAWLARNGLTRRIVLRTPHFLAALAAVGASEAVTTVSGGAALEDLRGNFRPRHPRNRRSRRSRCKCRWSARPRGRPILASQWLKG